MNSFNPDTEKKLQKFVQEKRAMKKAVRGTGALRLVAVFDADGTLWRGDAGESFFKFQLANQMLTPEYTWQKYIDEVTSGDKVKAYTSLATANAGKSEKDLLQVCRLFFRTNMKASIFSAMKALVNELKFAGFEVWVVSASPSFIVEAGALEMGIEPSRVIAVRPQVENGIIQDKLAYPAPYREKKVDAIENLIKTKPIFAAGNTAWDQYMMKEALEMALAIRSEKEGEPNFESEQELYQTALSLNGKNSVTWLTQEF